MKRIFLFLICGFLVFTTSCLKEESEKSKNCIENGVIVCLDPIWKVRHDTANIALSILKPYFQFDDKVIVETYKNKIGGIRCMEIETGSIIWEQYFESTGDYLIIHDTYFNAEENYLIFSIGSWGNGKQIKLNIITGEIIWELAIESFNSIEAYGDHYYCTVRSSGDVHSIYKVNIETGQSEYFYETDLPPHPDYNAQRSNWALPFEYNAKEYLFIGIMQMARPDSANFYYSLMDANTKERLLKHIPIESVIEKVDVKDGDFYPAKPIMLIT